MLNYIHFHGKADHYHYNYVRLPRRHLRLKSEIISNVTRQINLYSYRICICTRIHMYSYYMLNARKLFYCASHCYVHQVKKKNAKHVMLCTLIVVQCAHILYVYRLLYKNNYNHKFWMNWKYWEEKKDDNKFSYRQAYEYA